MQTYSLEEMREKTGMAMARLVTCWKQEKPIDGRLLRMREVDGQKEWWLEVVDTITDTSESGEDDANRIGDITTEFLKGIKGIGDKAANGIIQGCKDKGITSLAELAKVQDLTEFDGVGKVNGLNLREALTGLECETDGGESAYPDFVYDISPEDASAAKQMIDARRAGVDLPDLPLSNDAEDAFYAWEEEEFGVDILCPFCDGLFDRVTPGVYPAGPARCENDGEEERGNCGKRFEIVPTDDGYKTQELKETQQPEDSAIAPSGDDIIGAVGEMIGEVFSESEKEVLAEGEQAEKISFEDDNWDDWDDLGDGADEQEPEASSVLPVNERVHPYLTECRLLVRAEHRTDEWYQARSMGVGSSDAGAILGLSPYASPQDVFKTKIGEGKKRQPWLEDYAEFGSWFEPFLREWCERENGIEIIDGAELGTLQSIHWPHALANIDGLDTVHGVLEEYKTTTEKWTEIPLDYEAQCQHQMFVTGLRETRLRQFVCPVDRALVPSLLEVMRKTAILEEDADRALADWLLENGEVHTWIIERDDSYIARMIEREKTFWDFVTIEVEPLEQDPEGTVDLSDEPEVVAACEDFAQMDTAYQKHLKSFCRERGIDMEGRGSVSGKVDKAINEKKKRARRAIAKAIALHPEQPKRVTIGDHKATLVTRSTHSYWNLYAAEVEDVF